METLKLDFNLTLDKKGVTQTDNGFEFEGYASTFGNVDRHNDVIVQGAFRESLTTRMPSLLWQHNMDMPLGVFTEAREDTKGLFVKARMPLSDTFVRDRVVPQMQIRSINTMSIGFQIPDFERDTEFKDGIQYIKRVNLWEASLVTIPANPQAELKSVTGSLYYPLAPSEHEWHPDDAKDRLKAHSDATLDKGYLFTASNGKQLFPYLDVVDGKVMAVPAAIKSIRATLNNPESNLPMTSQEKSAVCDLVEKYYNRLDDCRKTESAIINLNDAKAMHKDRVTFERNLKSSGSFSRSAVEYLADQIFGAGTSAKSNRASLLADEIRKLNAILGKTS